MGGVKMRSLPDINKALPLAAAGLCLAYNVLTIILCVNLPNDPYNLVSSVWIYALAAYFAILLGIYGILAKRPSIIAFFTRFLLLDAFLSTICRMLLEEFFVNSLSDVNVCGKTFDHEHWTPIHPGYAVVTSARWESKFKRLFSSSETCSYAVVALHCGAVLAIMMSAGAQICLAILMQRYTRQIELERYSSPRNDDHCEKMLVRADSFDNMDRRD